MKKEETILWLDNLKKDIGQPQYQALWYYTEIIDMAIKTLQANTEIETCDTCKYYEISHKEYPCSDCTFGNSHYLADTTGEWRCMADYRIPECDQCGFASEHKYNYCPNCGKRMKVVE